MIKVVLFAWMVAACVTSLIYYLAHAGQRRRKREAERRENEEMRIRLMAEEKARKDELEKERVFQEVYLAHTRLEKQRARGYGPWLTCIIERRGCPAPVALTALRWTKNELLGRRFDLSCLDEAIESLEMGV